MTFLLFVFREFSNASYLVPFFDLSLGTLVLISNGVRGCGVSSSLPFY